MARREEATSRQWPWYVASVVVAALAGGVVLSFYDQIPDPFPTHWGPSGEPGNFRDKSVSNVLTYLLMVPLFMLLIFGIVAIAVGAAAKSADREPTRFESAEDLGRKRMLMSVTLWHLGWYQFVIISMLTVMVGYGLWMGASGSGFVFWACMSVMIAATVAIIVALARHQKRTDKEIPPTNYDPDKLKSGMIYWDPDDERLFISQADGMNMIPNLARPGAWGLMGALLLPAAIVTLIVVLAG